MPHTCMRWYTFCPRLPEALGPAQWESGAARASQNSGASAIRAFFPPESCHRIHDIDSCLGLPFCSSFSLSSTLFHSSAQGHSEMVVRAALPRPPLASAKAPVYTRTPSPSAVPLAGHQSHAPILCAAVAVWLAFAQPSLADPRCVSIDVAFLRRHTLTLSVEIDSGVPIVRHALTGMTCTTCTGPRAHLEQPWAVTVGVTVGDRAGRRAPSSTRRVAPSRASTSSRRRGPSTASRTAVAA